MKRVNWPGLWFPCLEDGGDYAPHNKELIAWPKCHSEVEKDDIDETDVIGSFGVSVLQQVRPAKAPLNVPSLSLC